VLKVGLSWTCRAEYAEGEARGRAELGMLKVELRMLNVELMIELSLEC
ncbi:hypothetical protein A2U01_0106788, partial [Trifolium medium]|nr:hypothetical protein [Trifolium medium]